MKMKTRFLSFGLLSAACLLLVSCASGPMVTVATDYNHKISFADYKTYALEMNQAPELRPTGRAALVDALKSSLAERGISETSVARADLVVVPRVFTTEKLHTMPTRDTTFVPYRGGEVGSGLWYMNNDVTQYTEGTLVLDFLDPKRRAIVFRGVGKGAMSTPERNALGIRDAVQRIVADLPR
jgi:hypothetical protein